MTPNTRRPTVEEVPNDQYCWQWGESGVWARRYGWLLRNSEWVFSDTERYPWLPYSAIPDPNNEQQQSQGE